MARGTNETSMKPGHVGVVRDCKIITGYIGGNREPTARGQYQTPLELKVAALLGSGMRCECEED